MMLRVWFVKEDGWNAGEPSYTLDYDGGPHACRYRDLTGEGQMRLPC
jgi:hypothetical protein